MALVKAFKGLRYTEKAGDLQTLCCPPYDIISEQERVELLNTNPYNIVRLELPTSYKDGEHGDPTAYVSAGKVVSDWLNKDILAKDKEENIYIYELSFNHEGRTIAFKGFIALVKLEEFSAKIVLPHEETLSKAKTDRFNLMTATGCNFSQIYSLFADKENAVSAVLEKAMTATPVSEITDKDGVTHKLWKLSDPSETEKISRIMSDKQVFIADGHHRYETALNYYKSVQGEGDIGTAAFVPMMLVSMDDPGLVVFPTHRLVRDLPDYNYGNIIAKCGEYFDITEGLTKEESLSLSLKSHNSGKSAFVLYGGDDYTLMVLKDKSVMKAILPGSHESLQTLDVSVLHSLVLERVFGIDKENMAAQKNLTYVKSDGDAIAAVDNKKANCCFLLNPTRISEIRDVSLAGEKMPQKSTYFYPKLITGLVMNKIK